MRYSIVFFIVAGFIYACGNGNTENGSTSSDAVGTSSVATKSDDGKGIGEIKHVEMNDPLNETMVASGKAIYEMKCSACHKLTGTRVVGPGFAGVTERRKPEWIMNMITNTDVMLAKDPTAQALLEECLTRMPNQNLSVEDARHVLEFFYANDAGTVEK